MQNTHLVCCAWCNPLISCLSCCIGISTQRPVLLYWNAVWNLALRRNLVSIGSGNGLLPDGTKPLPGPTLTCHQWGPVCGITPFPWQLHQKCSIHESPSGLAFTKSPNRKGLGKGYKGLEKFEVSSPILCCFWGQYWHNFQIWRKWDLKSQEPSANADHVHKWWLVPQDTGTHHDPILIYYLKQAALGIC